jgi:hypothetical protein
MLKQWRIAAAFIIAPVHSTSTFQLGARTKLRTLVPGFLFDTPYSDD